MLQLSKRVEYGLIALRHMAMLRAGQIFTAKEIASTYRIPYELLAKILQRLARSGLLVSTQGVHGGYALAIPADKISISRVIESIEQEKPLIAECYGDDPGGCSRLEGCCLREPLEKVQKNLNDVFEKLTIQEII